MPLSKPRLTVCKRLERVDRLQQRRDEAPVSVTCALFSSLPRIIPPFGREGFTLVALRFAITGGIGLSEAMGGSLGRVFLACESERATNK